jgi:uncharacterized protein YbjT (DUF2867 family)
MSTVNARGRIAVTGATGRVGRHTVELLEARGHEVIPISRSNGVDVVTGAGLAEALAGVECVIDAATGPSPDQQEASDFFTASARNLKEAGEHAGVRRIVLVSIIGCDRFAGGYNAAKVEQERALLSGPIPVHVLRAAQFHEFIPQLVEWGRQGDVYYVPEFRTQPVAARSVAEALAELAVEGGPEYSEIAGPRAESLVELGKLLVARRGGAARVERVTDPGDPDAELYASGGALPGPSAMLAGPSFEEWLEAGDLEPQRA